MGVFCIDETCFLRPSHICIEPLAKVEVELCMYIQERHPHSELAGRWSAAVYMIIHSLWSVKCTVHSTGNVMHVTCMLLGCYNSYR